MKDRIRQLKKADLPALHRMICDTIDASYVETYPPRAVDFFKKHHSKEKIAERTPEQKDDLSCIIIEVN